MLAKAVTMAPDAYVPDLEDSVPTDEKANARDVTSSFLPKLADRGPLVIPRVNSLGSGLLEDDLATVVGPGVFGVSVGKIDGPDDVERISSTVEVLEQAAGLPLGGVRLIPWIETARAVVNAYAIAVASPRVVALAFGAEDFTNDMGIERTDEDVEISYPRSVVCVAARAAGILALDTPYFSFRDPEGLARDALEARRLGFKGKFAIHPAQIEVINETFAPSPVEIEHARRVVRAFEEAERAGRGATSLDGRVIDVPVVERARNLLELAGAISAPGAAGE
jgi:citrate lyase subunit beta/citryl-CoA lyase